MHAQSQTAFETAKKDLSSVVAQAQKEIGKFSGEATAGPSGANTDATTRTAEDSSSDVTTPKGDEEALPQTSTPTESTPTSSFQFQSILSKVQSSLPPNLSQTLENHIPAALKDPHVDLASVRASLGAEFARVQGITRAQAEEYAHKSEALLREAGEYLKDAVRVLPPEDASEGAGRDADSPEVMLDSMGLGVVVMPPGIRSGGSRPSGGGGSRTGGKGKGRAQQTLAGSRAAAMVAKLKRDGDMLRKDPRADAETKVMFETWYKEEVQSKPGGITSEFWIGRTKEALEQEDSDSLKATRDSLGASILTLGEQSPVRS